MINKAQIIGHLGRDPELRHTQSGTPVASVSIATTEKYKDREGERREDTEWHRVTVWGNAAKNVAKYLRKGSKAYVEGRLRTQSFEDKEGVRRWRTDIVATRVVFLDGGRSDKPPGPDNWDENIPF